MTGKPLTLGAAIDQLYERRAMRLETQKKVDYLKKEEATMTENIMELMDNQETTKSAGKLASASLGYNEFPVVEDWDAFHAYVRETDQFHLLQRRVSDAAVKEIMHSGEDGEMITVPGTKLESKRKINIGKVNS